MAQVVLRVRLVGGGHMDIRYEDPAMPDESAIVDHVVQVLADDSGMIRAQHGDRLVVLFGRGVVALEVAPRGAVL